MDLFEDVRRAASACAEAEKALEGKDFGETDVSDDWELPALAGPQAALEAAAARAAQSWRAPGHGQCVRVEEARGAVFDRLAGRSKAFCVVVRIVLGNGCAHVRDACAAQHLGELGVEATPQNMGAALCIHTRVRARADPAPVGLVAPDCCDLARNVCRRLEPVFRAADAAAVKTAAEEAVAALSEWFGDGQWLSPQDPSAACHHVRALHRLGAGGASQS